ncbi:MAG TPA: hypothetical protein VJB63_01810 [Patescibacteria group bacterium]|nr:hypothetical protein [Patescibacteria group bacterium]
MLFSPIKFNTRSLVFIGILLIIFFFLAGFRLGKKIQQTDYKKITITPTQTANTVFTALQLKRFVASACGFQFLYPAVLKELENATNEATLTYQTNVPNQKTSTITISCDSPSKMKKFTDMIGQLKTEGIRIVDTVDINLYQSDVIDTPYVYFIHPESKKQILMRIPRNLLDLFESTLKFL